MKRCSSAVPLIDRSDFDFLLAEGRFGRWFQQARDLHYRGFCTLNLPDNDIVQDCEYIINVFGERLSQDLSAWEAGVSGPIRIQDGWRDVAAVRSLALHPQVLDLLRHLYGRSPFPFQTLNFAVGSEQPCHSDAVHFHCQPHGFMCGVWIPLVDVEADSGPLVYFPESHRLPYQSAATLGLTTEEVAEEPHPQRFFEKGWEADIIRLGLTQQLFLPRRGQVLIWHANLLHGGLPVSNRLSRRWSQVVHYYFEDCLYTTPIKSFRPDQGGTYFRSPVDISTGCIIDLNLQRSRIESVEKISSARIPSFASIKHLKPSLGYLNWGSNAESKLTHKFKGNLELISPSLITGWAYHPEILLSDVRLVGGDRLIAISCIDRYRSDVSSELGVSGSFGFQLDIPDCHPEIYHHELIKILACTADGSMQILLRRQGSSALLTEQRLRSALSPACRGMRGHFDGISPSGNELVGWCYSPFIIDVYIWVHAEGLLPRKVHCRSSRPEINSDNYHERCRFSLSLLDWPEALGRKIWASFDEEGLLQMPPLKSVQLPSHCIE